MNRGKLIDAVSASALDFAWLLAALAPASDYGDRAFERRRPFAPGEEREARARAERIDAVARSVDAARLDAAREALRSSPDVSSALARASMGDVLGDANLLELQRFFDAIVRIDATLAGVTGIVVCANEAVAATARALELGRAGKFGFYLADGFDRHLADARASLTKAQAEYDAVRGRTASVAAQALGRDDISGSEFIVMRADLRGALPAGVRVIREAPTYLLCELDADDATVAALERRDRAANGVSLAEESVRAALSSVVRVHAVALDDASRALGELDVLVAEARFAKAHACVVPELANEGALAFEDGRFLPLAAALEREGRPFTPLSVDLHDVAVLTGPNMGGKSVCLRTCGFIALCAAYGLPVPAARARVALFDDIAWLGIGSGDVLGGLLSSFAQEVVRLRDLLERDASRRFILIDEFARTTTPDEGKALLVALLGRLRAMDVCGMVATHLDGIAGDANARHYAVRGLREIPERPADGDLHAALAALAASMDYTIAEVAGERGRQSDALALASLLGLDDELIDAARRSLRERNSRGDRG